MQILSVMREELKEDGLCYFILKTVGEKTEGREERRGKEGTEKCVHHSHGEQGFCFPSIFRNNEKSRNSLVPRSQIRDVSSGFLR